MTSSDSRPDEQLVGSGARPLGNPTSELAHPCVGIALERGTLDRASHGLAHSSARVRGGFIRRQDGRECQGIRGDVRRQLGKLGAKEVRPVRHGSSIAPGLNRPESACPSRKRSLANCQILAASGPLPEG